MIGWCLSIPICIATFHAGKYYVEQRRAEDRKEALKLRNEIIAAGGSWEDIDNDEHLKYLDEYSKSQLLAVKEDNKGQAPKHSVRAAGY